MLFRAHTHAMAPAGTPPTYHYVPMRPTRTLVHLIVCALLFVPVRAQPRASGVSRVDLRSHILHAPAFAEIVDTLRARSVPVTIDDLQTIVMNAGDAESSGGKFLYGDDGQSFGYWQNKINVYLVRHFGKWSDHPDSLGVLYTWYTEMDSVIAVHRLVTEHYLNQDEYLQTFLEMLRVHSQRGRVGAALLKATIRSTNRGKRRRDYMDEAGTTYRDKCLKGVIL